MRHLEISDFGPIGHVSMNLKRVNVIIGPQSSGKSTVLKVACFCSWLERQIIFSAQPEKFFTQQTIEERLLRFYKMTSFMTSDTIISYRNDALAFSYTAKTQKWTFEWDKKRWSYKCPKIAYIPAERNLVSAIPNLSGETLAEKGDAMKVFPKRQTLRYDEVAAHSMKDGESTNIMNDEYHLISAEAIDEASAEIGADFDKLMSL